MNEYRQITEAFQENFRNYGELGASVSVWKEGREIVSLHSGFAAADETHPWTEHSLVPVYSATKGAASATLLLALHQQGASPQMSMGELWPEFPLPYASIAQMMSHQCGLAAFSRTASVFDHEDCVRALEETVPAWQPPEHGYHPHTYGVMLDELMLRLTGERLWRYWEEYIRKPLNLDFYIRLPESEWNRMATLYPGKMDMSNMGTPFYLEYMNKGTPVHRAFNTLIGLNSVRQMNTPEAWSSGVPAFGGVASARGMAQFYQACLGLDELRVFPSAVRGWMRNVVIDGPDLTLKTPTAFSCGFMHDPADPATGRKLVIVDASMTELIRPALYGSYHNIENITSEDEVREKYTIVGTACESTDVFDENVTLRKTRRGDLLTLKSAGAYGMSMASRYNLHDLPGAVYGEDLM